MNVTAINGSQLVSTYTTHALSACCTQLSTPTSTSILTMPTRAFETSRLNLLTKKCPSLAYRSSIAAFDTPIEVTVKNDSTSQTFTCFRGALIATSGYFSCALSGRWALNNSGHVTIEDDPKMFQFFLNYANTGRVVDGTELLDVEYVTPRPGLSDHTNEEDWPVQLRADGYEAVLSKGMGLWSTSFDDLVEIYAFADRRDAQGLPDLVVSMVLEKVSVEGRVPVEMLERLLGNTGWAR